MIRTLASVFRVDLVRGYDSPRNVIAAWVQSAIVGTIAGALVNFASGGRAAFSSVLVGICLAVMTGAIVGGLFGFIGSSLARVRRRWVWVTWIAFSTIAFASLAHSIRAFVSLGGRHHVLAVQVLAACAVAAAAFGSVTALVLPSIKEPSTWLSRRSPWWRLALCALFIVGGVVLSIADQKLFPGSYRSAHEAMRLATWYLIVLGVFTLGRWVRFRDPRARYGLGAALVALSLVPFFALAERDSEEAADLLRHPLTGIQLDLVRSATDFDGDGYSSFLGGGDCAAFDPKVSPSAREIFENGIDENCMGGDATRVLGVPLEQIPVASEPSPVDVVLITVDTLRADRLGLYGHDRPTSPHLDSFAESATVFESAYTMGGWTSLAVPALMRGLYPRRLDWVLMIETTKYRYFRPPLAGMLAPGEQSRARFILPVDDRHSTIPVLLQHRGMATAAVVDGGFTEILAKKWGAANGFETFDEVRLKPRRLRNDAGTTEFAIRALRRLRKEDKPFFLWVHYFGPHVPSTKHRGLPEFGSNEVDKYDHEIAYMDQQVGRLLRAIQRKETRPTEVIFTSDHGERIHNSETRGHGSDYRDDTLRVPMMIKSSRLPVGRVRPIVSTVDLLPTILAMTKSNGPPRLDGVNLAEYSPRTQTEEQQNRVVFAETFELTNVKAARSFRTDLLTAVQGDRKLVLDRVRQTTTYRQRGGDSPVVPGKAPKKLRDQVTMYLDEAGGVPSIDLGPGVD